MTLEASKNIAWQIFKGQLPWDYASTLTDKEANLVGEYLSGLEHCTFDEMKKRSER